MEQHWQKIERPNIREGHYVNMAHAFTPTRKNGKTCRVCGLPESRLIHFSRVVMGHGY